MKLLTLSLLCASLAACTAATEPVAESASNFDTATIVEPPQPDLCPVAVPSPSVSGNDGAWVRGVAHWDPSHFKPGAKPVLRVVLRHAFALVAGEEKIGGRLHGWTSIPIEDPSTGSIPFAIDMAKTHTMWSEGNGVFHVVFIIDEDGSNDLDDATTMAESLVMATPGPNELVKIADVDISCHAPSPCIDVDVDCSGGKCLEITPVTSCTKRLPACQSDGDFCH